MREAVIVSTARTPIGKAGRGAFNDTHGAVLGGHAIKHAVERSGVEPALVEDVILGCGLPEAATGHNIARLSAVRGGLPVTTAATTIHRFCSSGMQAISIAAQRIIVDGVDCAIGGGVESISLTQEHLNNFRLTEDWLLAHKPELWMTMIETADIVSRRYNVTREQQDEYALASQQRTAAAQSNGLFDQEIVPLPSVKVVLNKETNEITHEEVLLTKDEGNRPSTTLADLAKLKAVRGEGQFITAGNASQLSDGASACVLMESKFAEKSGLEPTRHLPWYGRGRLRAR